MKRFAMVLLAVALVATLGLLALRRGEVDGKDAEISTAASAKATAARADEVVPGEIIVVSVSGQVRRPGDIALGKPLLSDALIRSIPTPIADLKKIKILRGHPGGEFEKISVDATVIRGGTASDVPLKSGDMIYVSERIL